MPRNRMKTISHLLGLPFNDVIKDLYLKKNLASTEISERLLKDTGISITPRSIQSQLRSLGVTRTFSEAFNLAIKKGRKSYEHLRRTIKSRDMRKGITPKLRYQVLQRDKFRCVLCGKDAKEEHLEIDHIKPVVYGGTNDFDNLRTLCSECNKGKMLAEERKLPKI